jgi:hypothetical protein
MRLRRSSRRITNTLKLILAICSDYADRSIVRDWKVQVDRGDALCISFTLRENGATGYPPGDAEVVKLLMTDLYRSEAFKHVSLITFCQ